MPHARSGCPTSFTLLDELIAEEYNKVKQADGSCKICLFCLPSTKFSDYCKLRRKYIKHYNFCNSFSLKEKHEPQRTPSKEVTREESYNRE